jgi:uncharacterized protein (TIGR02453 family)
VRATAGSITPPKSLRFSAAGLSFLRSLKRHNDREWFRAHREVYDADVRAPMIAIIEQLAVDFRLFAPELVASPRASLYRIYRDTRFSEDKSPFKTHVAAVFPWRGLAKHEGGGLYFHVSPSEVWIGGGMYAPPPPQLARVREHIATNVRRFRRIVEAPPFTTTVGALDGERLQRVPRAYRPEHPAADYLRLKQYLAGKEYPGMFATSTGFYAELMSVFRVVTPLIRFLNEPLVARPTAAGRTRSV